MVKKSIPKGQASTAFRVGNHAESLLNVHRAVAAFAKKPKQKPSAKKYLFNIDETGQGFILPSVLTEHFNKVVGQMRHLNLQQLLVEDPLRPDFSTLFDIAAKGASHDDQTIPRVTAFNLGIFGLSALLKEHAKFAVMGNKSELIGYLQQGGALPADMTFSGTKTKGCQISEHTLGVNDVTPGFLQKDTGSIEELLAGFSGSTDYRNIVSLARKNRGVRIGRLWRLDAPIEAHKTISLSGLSSLNGAGEPRVLVCTIGTDDLQKRVAIVTGPDYEIEGQQAKNLPDFRPPFF